MIVAYAYLAACVVRFLAKLVLGYLRARPTFKPWPVFLRYVFGGRKMEFWARTIWTFLLQPLCDALRLVVYTVGFVADLLSLIEEIAREPWLTRLWPKFLFPESPLTQCDEPRPNG